MKKRMIKEGFYKDTYSKAIDKLRPEDGEYSFIHSTGYKSTPVFDKTRKFNTIATKYANNTKKKGIKIAISRLEDIWHNIQRVFFRGDTTNREDVKNVKSFWSKYVREFNSLMKELKESGDLVISDEKKLSFGNVKIGGDLKDFDYWFNKYNPYVGSWIKESMNRGNSNGGQTWGEVLNWNPENYEFESIIGDSYDYSYVYRVTPVRYRGVLKENVKDITIKIKSTNRLNRKQIFEKSQRYIKKNYRLFVESIDVTATGEVSGDSLKLIHNVIESSFPTYDVYERNIEEGDYLNKIEAKKLIDNILAGDITDMIGSSESMMKRVVSNLKELEDRGARVYRIYKDGFALGTFIKKVCKVKRTKELEFYGDNIKETLKMIASVPEAACDVNLISNEKDYCLVLVVEK